MPQCPFPTLGVDLANQPNESKTSGLPGGILKNLTNLPAAVGCEHGQGAKFCEQHAQRLGQDYQIEAEYLKLASSKESWERNVALHRKQSTDSVKCEPVHRLTQLKSVIELAMPCFLAEANSNDPRRCSDSTKRIALSTRNKGRQFVVTLRWAGIFGAGVLAMCMLPKHSTACLMRSDVPSSAYQMLSDQYQGQALWLRYTNESTGVSGPAGSAVRLNEWYALTAAHCVGYANETYSVGTGNNVTNNLGETRKIVSYIIHPGYAPNGGGTVLTPDIAILKFDRSLGGKDLTIAPPVWGEQITVVGFGRSATPATGIWVSDGKRRASDMVADYDHFGDFPGYLQMQFDDYFENNYYCNGRAAIGDSGGPNYNANDQLVALTIAVRGSADSLNAVGYTLSLQLSLHENWIATNTIVSAPTLFVQRNATHLVLSWNGSYTLQSATNMAGVYADVSGATSPYTNALTGTTQQFFRLHAASASSPSLLASPLTVRPQLKVLSIPPSYPPNSNWSEDLVEPREDLR